MKYYFMLFFALFVWGAQAGTGPSDQNTNTPQAAVALSAFADSEYCEVSYDASVYFFMEITSSGGIENLNYQTENQPEEGYDDLTAVQNLKTVPGAVIDMVTLFQGVGNTVKIWVDWNSDGEFSEDEKVYDFYNIDPSKNIELLIPETATANDYRMRIASFYGESEAGPCGNHSDGSALDFNIEIIEPDCLPANEIQYSITDDMKLQVNWVGSDEVTEWIVEYGDMTIEPGQGTQVTVTDTEFVLTNPVVDFQYLFYITAVCELEDSPTIASSYFYGYCRPRYTTEFFYLTDIHTEGAEQNIDYTTDQQPRNGYDNLTDTQQIVTNPGDSFTLTTDYFAGGNALKIWADWNKNLIFDDSEVLYDEHSMMGDHTVDITIPEDIAPGTYRFRVASRDNQPIEACGLYSYGSTIDFNLVIPGEECDAPTDIEVSNIEDTSVEVTWSPTGEENMWGVIYGEEGFTLNDDFNFITVFEPQATLSNLTPETDYDVYVVAICDPVNEIFSEQGAPVQFTTEQGMGVDSHRDLSFSYYPNPVEHQLNVEALYPVSEVVVYNLSGKAILHFTPEATEFKVDMQNLSSGIYFIDIRLGENSKTVRVIKE